MHKVSSGALAGRRRGTLFAWVDDDEDKLGDLCLLWTAGPNGVSFYRVYPPVLECVDTEFEDSFEEGQGQAYEDLMGGLCRGIVAGDMLFRYHDGAPPVVILSTEDIMAVISLFLSAALDSSDRA